MTAPISPTLIETWRNTAFNLRGGPVTYRRFVSETRNHKTGAVTPTYSNSIIALTLVGTTGSHESGRMSFRFRVSDIPEFPPDLRSRVLFRGYDWLIQSYTTDQEQKVVTLQCVRP